MSYSPAIGIEVHVELRTESKMFCGCSARFGDPPNTNVCPVCLGLPGALPVPNRLAIEGILTIGTALECSVNRQSLFHRKNYFYADMPKNYQISQFDVPICVGGRLDVPGKEAPASIRIHRVHMEEDTGKSIHVGGGGRIHEADYSRIDFNRAGVPLVEIVSEPDIRSAAQGRRYAQELREVILTLGVSDARLEEGGMRFDANVSVSEDGSGELGTKVEVKNMNSFRSLERAISYEVKRQSSMVEGGEQVVLETRHWDEEAQETQGMRSKEESSDYRYFPEPDLVPMHIDDGWLDRIADRMPELPSSIRARYQSLGLSEVAAATIVSAGARFGQWFEEAVEAGAGPAVVANQLTEVQAWLRREGVTPQSVPLTGAELAELVDMVASGRLSSSASKEVLGAVLEGGGTPLGVATSRDLFQVSDSSALEGHVEAAIATNPSEWDRLSGGDDRLIGFFVGQVMKLSGGKADPRIVSELIQERIEQAP